MLPNAYLSAAAYVPCSPRCLGTDGAQKRLDCCGCTGRRQHHHELAGAPAPLDSSSQSLRIISVTFWYYRQFLVRLSPRQRARAALLPCCPAERYALQKGPITKPFPIRDRSERRKVE